MPNMVIDLMYLRKCLITDLANQLEFYNINDVMILPHVGLWLIG